jgi:hypothetical protein
MAGKIFINYRRADSIAVAGRLRDRLAEIFGRDKIFMDVEDIPIGCDFVDDLEKQVAACDAMLSIVGPNWLSAKDAAGQPRLGNPGDYVTIEVKTALARKIPVIPVLVDGTAMPTAEQLPDSLKLFARRNAFLLRNTNFGGDAGALVKKMREALGDKVLVSDGREALGDKVRETGPWRVEALKKHVISTLIGLVIGLLASVWLELLTLGGISLLLLVFVAVANAGALFIPLRAEKRR